jgi:hypothetical protein
MSEANSDRDRQNPWSAPRFIAAAIIIGLIAAAGIFLLVSNLLQPHTRPAARQAAPAASSSMCGLPDGKQAIPVVAPETGQWTLVGTMAVPSAPKTIGPGVKDATGLRHCFARSPLGALYATVNYYASAGAPSLRVPAAKMLVSAGPGRTALIKQMEATPPSSGVTTQVAGFRFVSYSSSAVTVDIAVRGSTGALGSVPTQLTWEAGDWKLVVNADGTPPIPFSQLQSLTGYVTWFGA